MFHACFTSWRVYMDPITVRVHYETNLWKTQRNLVGTGGCRRVNDLGWFPTTPSYCLLGPKIKEGHLALAHKLDAFYLVMGLCSSWWCFIFPRCMWREWDSCPFHHRHLDTYTISSHAPIQSQRAYFYGCHVWYE
jgi:hypothetical protein